MAEIIVDPVALAGPIFAVAPCSAQFIICINSIEVAAFIIIGNV